MHAGQAGAPLALALALALALTLTPTPTLTLTLNPDPKQAHKAKPADEQARVAYERAKVEFAAFQKAKKARVGSGGSGDADDDDAEDDAEAAEAGETSRLLGDDAFLCKLCGCSVAAAAAKTHLGGAKHAQRVEMLMAVCEATPPKKGDWVCCARRPKHTNDQPQLNYASNSGTQPPTPALRPKHTAARGCHRRRRPLPRRPRPCSPAARVPTHQPTTAHSPPTTAHATAAATHRPPLPRRLLQGRLRRGARHDGPGLR